MRDATFRRVRAAMCPFTPGYMDLDEHAALVTLDVHRARLAPRAPQRRAR